jgi:hypothetical protein
MIESTGAVLMPLRLAEVALGAMESIAMCGLLPDR